MPFLALVHLRELLCAQCGVVLAQAGARSFLVDASGEALSFPADAPPGEMTVAIFCPSGHENVMYVPNELAAEEALLTPDDAPIARDAVMLG